MMKKITRTIFLVVLVFLAYQFYVIRTNVKQVLSFQSTVQEVLISSQSPASEDLILAMIYTETKGLKADVMQSSEAETGTTNTISDSRESIQVGVAYLNQMFAAAEAANLDSWTAVQAYNYGPGYISYVAANGGENTIELSKNYSLTIVAPSLGNSDGETYTYYHPIAVLNGGKLYVNGGNIYYSRQVEFNQYLIRFMKLFI
ncbi:lysozyme family protein [Streptococcus sp. 29896]|uniref:Lysozyme family protein n=1 Tax=Streptococcus suivaginalis TaxID=3028082 RepID=A0AA96VE10_9STRE|nr:lysozyme family protein [Streptococcus sp. 29896]WNY48085.1 lysozyme family protein [Streptococcus sp. 29896]